MPTATYVEAETEHPPTPTKHDEQAACPGPANVPPPQVTGDELPPAQDEPAGQGVHCVADAAPGSV